MKTLCASSARHEGLSRRVRNALAVVVVVVLAACSGSKESRIASGLEKGAEFVRQGDWDKANIEVRNVLQIDPKNAQAFLISAQVSEAQRDVQRAFGAYTKALELKPDLLEAQVGLARIYLLVGDIPKAEQKVNEALAVDAADAGARTLQAALLFAAGKTAAAQALVRQVLAEGDKAPVDAHLVLAGMHARAREWSQALVVIEAGLQRDPKHRGLLLAAVEMVSASSQDPSMAGKAVGYFERATAAAPRDHELWLAWTRYHLSRKEPDLAEAVLRAAIKVHPDEGKRRLALLDFLLAVRGVPVAEKEYLSFIADKPRDMALRFGLASLYRNTSRPVQAQEVLAEIVDLSDDTSATLAAQTQLAGYRLAAGQLNETRDILAKVLKANPRDNAALVLSGRLHLMAGNPNDAVADLRAALRDQPGSLDVVQLLAQALRAAGQPQLAREAVADAAKARPDDADLRALVAADLADARDFKSAHAELDSAIKALPQAARLYELKAQLAQSQKDFALAERTLQQLKAKRPSEARAYVRLGQLYTAQ
ncbi:MAG: tetratricopeptide repeat protein, partial [Chitinophagaceae bacterium]|nr:tetratricopeptide repeat protein [Rubrivivax sp.]